MGKYNAKSLVRLSDTDEFVLDPAADVTGRTVVDSAGTTIGTVSDLLVDLDADKVRALLVDDGSGTVSAIPVDAITSITADEVHLSKDRKKVAGAPAYDPTLVYDDSFWIDYYDYWGFTPYWYDEYVYPDYPFFVVA
jgi:sporulation protein YlmC with PRC-barrel domain